MIKKKRLGSENASSDAVKLESINNKLNIVPAKTLLDMNIEELPFLVKPLLPMTGVVALCGASDTGKSSLLRQLAICITLKKSYFLGLPITARYHRAIYISTEDDIYATAYLLKKIIGENRTPELDENLSYIFETDALVARLDEVLGKFPVDCIIFDTFSDVFKGDLNASNSVRSYINMFSEIASKYGCLVIFLHHTGKRTENLIPSKNNLLGSQGFEAKMRLVIELRRDHEDPSKRHLCLVKGNYLADEYKQESFVLKQEADMLFTMLPERVHLSQLVRKSKGLNDGANSRAYELWQKKLSVREIHAILVNEGYEIGKSTVGNWVQEFNKLNLKNNVEEPNSSDDPYSDNNENAGGFEKSKE